MLQTVTSLPNRQCPAQGLFFLNWSLQQSLRQFGASVGAQSQYLHEPHHKSHHMYIYIYVYVPFMKYHFQNMVRLGFHFVLVGPGFQDQVVVVVVCPGFKDIVVLVVGGFVLQGSLTTGPGFQDQAVVVGLGFKDFFFGCCFPGSCCWSWFPGYCYILLLLVLVFRILFYTVIYCCHSGTDRVRRPQLHFRIQTHVPQLNTPCVWKIVHRSHAPVGQISYFLKARNHCPSIVLYSRLILVTSPL